MLEIRKYSFYVLFILLLLCPAGNPSVAAGYERNENTGSNCNEENQPLAPDFITRVTAEEIEEFYTRRHENRFDAFNGCVMVAKDGRPIYTGAFGYANFFQKDTLTPQSPFQLASTTKPFTATAILKLVEEGKLSLDDSIQKFFPAFPYHGITVKLLLCHRTGLPDYIYWSPDFIGRNNQYLTNQSMLELFIKKKPQVRCKPDRIFMYSNTNYALLALIIEKVSGVSYKQYIESNIFRPLGMHNSFVFSIEDSASHCGAACYESRWHEWNLVFSDGVVGDKGIYSSVEDMLKWDNALRSGKILSSEMQEEAYRPHNLDRYSFAKERNKNYGYGWRMSQQADGNYMIYHNGNWHGCNNVFARNMADGYTVIVLSNKANEKNYYTQPVWDILERMKNAQNIASAQ